MGNLRQSMTDDEWYERQEKIKNQSSFSESGFFDLPQNRVCSHPSHNPPSHIVIPQGKGYRHVCPACGQRVDIIPPQVTL